MKTKVHFLQTYIVLLSGIAATLLPVSCSEADSLPAGVTPDASAGEKDRVEILIPRNITRTYISEDEYEDQAPDHKDDDYEDYSAKVGWNDNDKLTLWAKSESGTRTDAITFTYLGPSYDMENRWTLFYSKEVKVPDDRESLYTYYAVSPVPDNADDRYAYFTIPAEQGGRYDRGYKGAVPDILWAPPVQGAKCLMPDVRNLINFRFEHKLHALKIIVPEVPFTNGIKQMRIEFPYNVAGKLQVDLESGATSLTEGTNAITLTFDDDRRLMPNDTCWVFVAPTAAGAAVSGKVHFIATDGTDFTFPKESEESGDGAFDFSKFTARSITPVRLYLEKNAREQVDFTVTMQDNHLGEDVDAVLTLPEGGSGNQTNIFPTLEQSKTRKIHFEGKSQTVTIKMYKDVLDRIKSGTLSVMLESEHAEGFDVSNTVTSNTFAFTAPYLFSEDFSGISDHEYNSGYSGTLSSDTKNYPSIDLKTYGLDGWTGTRVGLQANKKIRIQSRFQKVFGDGSRMKGRVESAAISHLKENVTVQVSVAYDYATDRASSDDNGEPLISFGYTEKEDGAEADDDNFLTLLFNEQVKTPDNNKKGSDPGWIGNTPHTETQTIPACTKKTRLGWRISNNKDNAASNGAYRLYIDNVRVWIVPE